MKSRLFMCPLLALFLGMSANANAQSGLVTVEVGGLARAVYEKSSALLISVSKQDYPQSWRPLTNIPSEMDALESALKAQNFQVERLRDPTGAELYSTLKEFLARAGGHKTRTLIYYSGHGASDEKSQIGYIVPRDAPSMKENMREFKSKAMSMTQIQALAKDADSTHTLFVFDSCFSGMVFLTRSGQERLTKIELSEFSNKAKQFITAGNEKDEVPGLSDFTPAFIDGMNGAADDGDGIVTASELGRWLKKTIAQLGKQTPQEGFLVADYTTMRGEFMFVPPSRKLKVISAPQTISVPVNNSALNVTKEKTTTTLVVAPKEGEAAEKVGAAIMTEHSMQKSPFRNIDVRYYKKSSDGDALVRALDQHNIPYAITKAERPERFKTNAIACNPDVPVDRIKAIASLMIDSGFPIKAIIPFKSPQAKPNRIEILTMTLLDGPSEREWPGAPLSKSDIDGLTRCESLENSPI